MVNSGGNGGRRDLRPRNANAVRLRGAVLEKEDEDEEEEEEARAYMAGLPGKALASDTKQMTKEKKNE